MGPFGRAAVGLIVNKDGSNKKKNKGDDSGPKAGRRNASTLPSWFKDDHPEAKGWKDTTIKEGNDKWIKESKERNKKNSLSGNGEGNEEMDMEISSPIPDEDFRLATSLLGLNRIKTRSGPLLLPGSTRSGPVFAGTLQSRFDTGKAEKREAKTVNNNWTKGESSTRLLTGVRKASKVHARDSLSPKDSSRSDSSSYWKGRTSIHGESSSEMPTSPLSDGSPRSSNMKKLQRSSRIGDLEKTGGGRLTGCRLEGSFDSQASRPENCSRSDRDNCFSGSLAEVSPGKLGNSSTVHASSSSAQGETLEILLKQVCVRNWKGPFENMRFHTYLQLFQEPSMRFSSSTSLPGSCGWELRL